MTVGAEVGPAPATDPLTWVTDALWADDVEVHLDGVEVGGEAYIAHPSLSDPEILVPLGSRRTAAVIARRTSDARSLGDRARNLMVELAAGSGLLALAAGGRRVTLHVGPGGEDPGRSLPALVADVLGLSDIRYAITLGKERYNRKPVLAVFDSRGRPRAYVKAGVDAFTDESVARETRWLQSIAASRPYGFVAPDVVWSGQWRGHQVLVLGPLSVGRFPTRGAIDRPPPGLVSAVAALGGPRSVRVEDAAPIAEASQLGDPRLDRAVERILERHGDVRTRVGAWHGDLSPWNIASRRHGPPSVWDWEAAAEGRPVGADLLHNLVMVPTHLRGVAPSAALAALEPDAVAAHQPSAAGRAATLDLYLLDVARRDLQILAGGVDARLLPGIGAAALDRIAGHD
jgi:hypothetical protein